MTRRASVLGAGVGGLTTASLLSRQGWDVDIRDTMRRPPPALVVNELAEALLHDVFGPGILDGGHLLEERRVRWGPGAAQVVVPTRSVAIDGALLLARLRSRSGGGGRGTPDWLVDGTGRDGNRIAFGRRSVIQVGVTLTTGSRGSSWLESVEDGWLHLAPLGGRRAVLQVMVASPPCDPAGDVARMVAATADIKDQVEGLAGEPAVFPAEPSLSSQVCAPGRISVADAAITVDPLSGFGTGWALRGGILAAAVIDACASGLPEHECLHHYGGRLGQAMVEHVDRCLRLYGQAFSTIAWKEELSRMASARAAMAAMSPPASFAYRLNGFRLEPVAPQPVAEAREMV